MCKLSPRTNAGTSWNIKSLVCYLLTLSIAGASNQEEATECSDNVKEETIDGQDSAEKSKVELKTMHEENLEKEGSSKKEVRCTLTRAHF